MRLSQYISVKLSICLIAGILIGKHIDITLLHIFFATLILLIASGILFTKSNKKSIAFGICAALTTICLGIFSFEISQPKNNPKHYSHSKTDTASVWKLKIDEALKSNSFSERYIATVLSKNDSTVTGKILLSIQLDSIESQLNVDNEILVYSTIDAINTPLNPHQFNYANYMGSLGVYYQMHLKSNAFILQKSNSKTLKGIAAKARNSIISKLEKSNFGQEELGIIKALLLGQRNDIDPKTLDNYKNAGAIHILALSGLHIGILLLLLQFLLQPLEQLPKGRQLKLIIIVALLWGFAFIAGMSPSLVRAVTMFTFVAYALYLNRPTGTFNILALSLFFILLFQPQLLFTVSFQMSYAAVFSIVLFYPMLQKLVQFKFWLPNKIWQLFSVSVAAQLGVLPISLLYFHQFPGLFFISNLVIVPFLGLILGVGIIIILLSLFNVLPSFLANLYNYFIGLMNSIIKWIAEQDAFLVQEISFDKFQLILSYAVLIILLIYLSKKSFKKAILVLSGIILFQAYTIYSNYKTANKETLLVFHKNRNTVFAHRTGNELNVVAASKNKIESTVADYTIAERISSVLYNPLQNSYRFKNNTFTIIDSSAVYNTNNKLDIVLLSQSPKINLERFIALTQPKLIIVDGSNFKNVVAQWKATCTKRKIPFHYTGEKGFYEFNLN